MANLIDGASVSYYQAQAASSANTQAYTPVDDEAARILDVGSRFGRDDYAARLESFSQSLAAAPDRAYREQLIAQILVQDPGALQSWLNPSIAMDLKEDGRMSASELRTLAETYAAAFNNGDVASEIRPRDLANPAYDWYDNPDAQSTIYPGLDDAVFEYAYSGYNDSAGRAEQVADFIDFLNHSDGPEVARFRADYAQHLLDNYVLNEDFQPAYGNSGREAAAGIVAQLIGGDALRPGIAVDTLSQLSSQDLTTFLDLAADSKNLFARDALLDQVYYDANRAAAISQPDAIATVFNAVARSADPRAGDLAAGFARYAQSQPAWFTDGTADRGFANYDYQARADSMTRLLSYHTEAVLDALTAYEDVGARTVADTDLKQYEVNGRDLAALLELTVLNADTSPHLASAARNGVLDYLEAQAAIVNAPDATNSAGFEEAGGRIAVFAAATDVAVDRGYQALADDIQARKETIAFIVDLALIAVPLPARVKAATGTELAGLVENSFARQALEGLSGKVIDEATGRLTGAAKEQFYAALDADPALAELEDRQAMADALRSTILDLVTDERDRFDIQTRANGLADDISGRD